MLKSLVLAIAILMYLLVILREERKVVFTTTAAILVIVLSIIFRNEIFKVGNGTSSSALLRTFETIKYALLSLINWNVLLIYLGSMTLAALFIYSKVPSLIAESLVSVSPSSALAIIFILALTGIISIFVENVATVLLMAPIALSLSKKLKIKPTCFLIGLSVMSNLEGTATLVGDPPSMIFASFAHFSFNDFFFFDGKISIFFFVQMGLLAGCVYFYFFFKDAKEKVQIEKTKPLSFVPLILLVVMITGLAGISFLKVSHPLTQGLFTLLVALIGLVWFKTQNKTFRDVKELVLGLDWETIFFLSGIFVVVGAVSEVGLLESFALFLSKIVGGNKLFGFVLILFVSVILSGFIDNVPYIITMLPVASRLATTIHASENLFMFALLLGSCLGGNLTCYGASANVATIGLLKKEGFKVTFGDWLKVALPFTLITTAASALLLYFTLG